MEREINELKNIHFLRWNELPNIRLYVDQVVNIIEEGLKFYAIAYPNEKLITKSMINNYVKQGIIPPPVNKKYDKNHLACLLIICLFKKIYSINDLGIFLESYILRDDIDIKFDSLCDSLEYAIKSVLEKEYTEFRLINEDNELVSHAILSFVHYLYVQKIYLPNFRKNKEK